MEPHSSVLTINLGAIAENYRNLQAQAGDAEIAAVVKANAYGLGIEQVAPVLSAAGCRCFFVATIEEGVQLRALIDGGEIHVLNGPLPGQAKDLTAHHLTPVLNSLDQINQWSAHCNSVGTK